MGLDHGLLNVPLSKRGDIDAQIDGYKRATASEMRIARRAAAAQHQADKAEATALMALHKDALVASFADRFNPRELLRTLEGLRKWEPATLLLILRKYIAETSGI